MNRRLSAEKSHILYEITLEKDVPYIDFRSKYIIFVNELIQYKFKELKLDDSHLPESVKQIRIFS
tara:strand:+ start:5108 stop:5302 length:195 start_codon:yes stop_codon:yes gene_type:complete